MFSFRALASGSSGNAFLLRTSKVRLLFDAGITMVALRRALAQEGLSCGDLTGVLISHEHTDHCLSARDLASAGTPVWSNSEVLGALKLHGHAQTSLIEVGKPALLGDVEVTCFAVSHDAVRPMGFFVRAAQRTLVLATDLGEYTSELGDAIRDADLVVLEANHDLRMLHEGHYPYFLRRRVSGPRGHLSNDQAAGILASHVKKPSVDIWLAHLSKENNTPRLALRTVSRVLKEAGSPAGYLATAARDKPSLRWNGVPRPVQLQLFDPLAGL